MFYLGAENYDGRLQKVSDEDTSKDDLHKASVLSSGTMTKLRKGEDMSIEALRKICRSLRCNIGDIAEFVDESK